MTSLERSAEVAELRKLQLERRKDKQASLRLRGDSQRAVSDVRP